MFLPNTPRLGNTEKSEALNKDYGNRSLFTLFSDKVDFEIIDKRDSIG
jgi:hypothetical protein